ncbi:MAG: transketolase [Hyphomicrobiaceae bacterium]|nr:transketolase [Hyphomicrobiaceae bacterium]
MAAVNNLKESTLFQMANAIRALSMDCIEQARSGHPGLPLGMADVATVLFAQCMKYNPKDPTWLNRDRFVLSAGHGSMLLYALLHLTGYSSMTRDELKNFRRLGSKTAGHPEFGLAEGIETTTGPLGQGLSNAVGMAIAERIWNTKMGDVIDHHTFVIAGDGCLMEGISHESISLAGHLKLGKLILLFDDNKISIDGPTSLTVSDDQKKRFEACGWNTAEVNGHDMTAIRSVIKQAKSDTSAPWMIACKTVIGKGAPNKSGSSCIHGTPLGKEEIAAARLAIEWPHKPFVIPDDILTEWRKAGARHLDNYDSWKKKWCKLDTSKKESLKNPISSDAKKKISVNILKAKMISASGSEKKATRKWSELVIEHLLPVLPALVGGSADLTGSNNTKGKDQTVLSAENFSARYIHFGVREHSMAAAMNGMALYGGLIPYGGTFLVFSDYCRPSIRLSSLMKQRVIYVMTHDSIGLGEDGPTHQPIEHLAALRAIPNLYVLRPADGVETAECWQLAIEADSTPSILSLSRQTVDNLRHGPTVENLCAKGAYVLIETSGKRDVTLIATGSEVGLASEAADKLKNFNINAAVVSMPSMELFRRQSSNYRATVLGDVPRVFIEAGIQAPWFEWMEKKDYFIGLIDFGASAPAEKLFDHFGLTSDAVISAVKRTLDS